MLWAWLKKILFPSTGAWAEREAAKFLKDKGIKILARNYKAHPDELDIIAREKRELVFVEVRARKAQAIVPGAQTLGAKKHHALRRGIRAYLRENGHGENPPWRFDIVEVKYKTRRDFEIYHYPRCEL